MRSSCWFVFLCALPAGAMAQTDYSKVQIKATKVAGNVYMLEGAGGNIGVSVGTDGILIVDDQFAPLADKIRAALKGSIRENCASFSTRIGTAITRAATRRLVRRLRSSRTTTCASGCRLNSTPLSSNRPFPPSPKEALPVITFDQSLSVHFNGEEIRAIHFPQGHTDGDSIIFFTKSNVVHLGDDFFAGSFPFVDLDSGGSVEGLTKNIGELITKIPAGAKLIPGHGPLSTLDDLKPITACSSKPPTSFARKIAAGKSLDQIKSEGLPDEWNSWGTGFIKTDVWLELIHRSLTREVHGLI